MTSQDVNSPALLEQSSTRAQGQGSEEEVEQEIVGDKNTLNPGGGSTEVAKGAEWTWGQHPLRTLQERGGVCGGGGTRCRWC